MRRVLAFDFGASSGRAIIGIYDGESIQLEEVHRFSNDPVLMNGTLYWDTLRLLHEIKQGIMKAKHQGGFDSIGIDTWGVDFGLIDEAGDLIEHPVHYRDQRTQGMVEACFNHLSQQRLYEITGNQMMELNTVFQLLALSKNKPQQLERADKLLLMPDLFNYMLTGIKRCEYTIASTTQLLDAKAGTWSDEIITALGLPRRIFADMIQPATVVGPLSQELANELNVPQAQVISVAAHDTQSAVLAVPATEEHFAFISCGTWSMVGTELAAPLITEQSARLNMTNEGGVGGTTTFMKNIIGLWLIQESRRQWEREGQRYSFAELEQLALQAEPFTCFIDPDHPEFAVPGDVPARIRAYCKRTQQFVPETIGQITRCIYESLALKYRYALEQIQACTERKYTAIHMVGGGIQSQLLCQMTANSCTCTIIAGPIEATVLGNIASQLIALGDIRDVRQARCIISNSADPKQYTPDTDTTDHWNDAYTLFTNIIEQE